MGSSIARIIGDLRTGSPLLACQASVHADRICGATASHVELDSCAARTPEINGTHVL